MRLAEPAGDHHGDHRADAARRHQQAGLRDRIAAEVLQIGRQQRRARQQHHADGEHHQEARRRN